MKNEKEEKLSQEDILAAAADKEAADEKTLNAEIVAEEIADEEAADKKASDKEAADKEEADAEESSEKASKANAKAKKDKKQYVVLVSVMGGKGKKIFKHKDKVTAEELNGDVKDLIAAGFIK